MNAKTIISFILGAAIGSGVTFLVTKKEIFQRKEQALNNTKAKEQALNNTKAKEQALNNTKAKEDLYEKVIAKGHDLVKNTVNLTKEVENSKKEFTAYNDITKKYAEKKVEPEFETDEPHVISIEEFYDPDYDHYDKIGLYYTSDGKLIDENNELVENPDEKVGKKFVNHFGDDEEDSAYIRNDKLETDYEIVREDESYSEVTGKDKE